VESRGAVQQRGAVAGRRLTVSVDGRPLDIEHLRTQGIGRYAQGLLGPLARVASERGGELVVLRERRGGESPFGRTDGPMPRQSFLLRPPVPTRAVELVEQWLLPFDLVRLGVAVHHSLSIYRTPLVSRAPVVVTMHDVAPLQWPALYLRTGLVHRTLYRAVRRAAAIMCPSRAAREDLLRHLDVDSERVSVVPEAADERFRPTDPSEVRARLRLDGPYLLYVGGLVHRDPRKDVEGLIDAFSEWSRTEDRPETLVLAGEVGPAARELERRARGARVLFAGFVAEADLPALYSGASCLVTASRYEGFGLPALEAIACGTPVVAYEAGAVAETAGPGALLVPSGDGTALMHAAGRLCDEPELTKRLAEDGRQHAGSFSWRRTAELTWDVYERVGAGA
jgi:glycosyltransferase involved in cell wall biosynthesis